MGEGPAGKEGVANTMFGRADPGLSVWHYHKKGPPLALRNAWESHGGMGGDVVGVYDYVAWMAPSL